jgi:hypothetical protein
MKCIPKELVFDIVTFNTVFGVALGVFITGLFYVGGSSKYLLINEFSSDKVFCSTPKKTQFKCAVYKNGELLQNLPIT